MWIYWYVFMYIRLLCIICMLLCLLRNMLPGKEIIPASEELIRAGQDFLCCLFL